MASSLVIVAIPSEDDYVWKISSEKVPHCTLLFLGDAVSNPNVSKIQEFLEHAVNILELGPFGLEVDYRGLLGTDDADVVFFRRDWSLKRIAEFRGQLLKSEPIRTAWESADQFDPYPNNWIPHLTLGYPSAPAREDKRDFPGLRWIEFNRIALWFGDFEGPEWRLQYNFDLATEEVGMSAQAGKEFLEHYGVKGMKWGVRKRINARGLPHPTTAEAQAVVTKNKLSKTKIQTRGGERHPPTEDAIKAALAKQKVKRSGTVAMTNAELQELANRMNLEQNVRRLIDSEPKGLGRQFVTNLAKDPHKTARTAKEVADTGLQVVGEVQKRRK